MCPANDNPQLGGQRRTIRNWICARAILEGFDLAKAVGVKGAAVLAGLENSGRRLRSRERRRSDSGRESLGSSTVRV